MRVPRRVVTPVGVRCGVVIAYCHDQVAGASIVKEEEPCAESPKRSGSELVRSRIALDYIIRERCTHVVDEQVGVEIHGLPTQRDHVWADLLRGALWVCHPRCLE